MTSEATYEEFFYIDPVPYMRDDTASFLVCLDSYTKVTSYIIVTTQYTYLIRGLLLRYPATTKQTVHLILMLILKL